MNALARGQVKYVDLIADASNIGFMVIECIPRLTSSSFSVEGTATSASSPGNRSTAHLQYPSAFTSIVESGVAGVGDATDGVLVPVISSVGIGVT